LILYLGAIVFLSLITTATMGIMIMKGSKRFTMKQHMLMARITIVFAIIHGILGMLAYF
jgi:hypothetical protein